MFLFLSFEIHKCGKYSVFIKMKFLFQQISKGPNHLQRWKIYRKFSHDYYMLRQQYKIVLLKCCCSFLQISRKYFCIYCHLPSACFCVTSFGTYFSPWIKLYTLCSGLCFCLCLLAINITFRNLQCSALQYSFGSNFGCNSVIKFLVPFHVHVFCLVFFVSKHFEFSFQLF